MIEKSKKCRTVEKLLEVAERQLILIDSGNNYELMAFYTEIKDRSEHYEKLAVIQNERRNKMELRVAFLKFRIAVLKEQNNVLKEQYDMQIAARIERIDALNKKIDECFCCIN